ncbi:hypothetical protein DFH06DRAFT_1207791 [Mycena polygramma]|nr:hypothetical protein DFH06DRAFT_1207791 [Mycena polygramma]
MRRETTGGGGGTFWIWATCPTVFLALLSSGTRSHARAPMNPRTGSTAITRNVRDHILAKELRPATGATVGTGIKS